MIKRDKVPYFKFLSTPMVTLQAAGSSQIFRMHQGLLTSKANPIASPFDQNSGRESKGVYTFKDTSEGILARFMEWAYTGDYPLVIEGARSGDPGVATKGMKRPNGGDPDKEKPDKVKTDEVKTVTFKSSEDKNIDKENPFLDSTALAGPDSDPTLEEHALLVHIRLYIFASIYMVPDMRDLCFQRATAAFTELDQPNTPDAQRSVIAALRLSFANLLPDDKLLGWLGLYTSYNLAVLRYRQDFHSLLYHAPGLSSRMMLSLSQVPSPPWKVAPPDYTFAESYTDLDSSD